ncbi:MAG TPA: zinc-binding dehydrogenase, partial [Burkholderiaceae bacterium]
LKAATGGRGADLVFDPVGGDLAEPALRGIAWRGRYLVVGFADGRIPALPWNLPLLKGASIVGVFWGEFVRREPEANARMLGALAAQYAHGLLKPVIDEVLPLSRLPEAYARLAQRRVLGKLVLVPDALLERR